MTINVTFTTNRGPIHLRLHEDKAPVTVANFVNLGREIGRASCRERV